MYFGCLSTTNCVRRGCTSEALSWTGHVTLSIIRPDGFYEQVAVLAGNCALHGYGKKKKDSWRGLWKPRMGVELREDTLLNRTDRPAFYAQDRGETA